MEEQQIQNFVHRVLRDEETRRALASDPRKVILGAAYSPRVIEILFRLVPHLAFDQPLVPPEKWWHA